MRADVARSDSAVICGSGGPFTADDRWAGTVSGSVGFMTVIYSNLQLTQIKYRYLDFKIASVNKTSRSRQVASLHFERIFLKYPRFLVIRHKLLKFTKKPPVIYPSSITRYLPSRNFPTLLGVRGTTFVTARHRKGFERCGLQYSRRLS